MLLADIANNYQLEFIGNSRHKITSIASLLNAKASDLTFATNSKQIEDIINTQAGCVITTKELAKHSPTNTLISDNPYLIIAQLSQQFKKLSGKIHPTSVISDSCQIGNNTTIDANCYLGENIIIGNNCHLYPGVKIINNVQIGDNCVIHPNAVIGSQGFGNIPVASGWQNIYHLGGVKIGSGVHIGANTTIDNGTFDDTIIENGVRIDNLVHIAHNVHIGEHTAIAALSGIAGSTTIGKRCKIGGKVGIVGHLNIADDTTIYATSTVNKSIKKSGEYTSFMPIMPHTKWKKVALLITKFDKIVKFLKIKISNL
jgi:UDP-3-O-[3-hydroxymyristoyl] glucosamine N-acyltransferase